VPSIRRVVRELEPAVGLTRLLDSLLFGVGTLDPLTFGVVSVVLLAVALAACLCPRGSRGTRTARGDSAERVTREASASLNR
jgi:hypothetical protein